MKTFAKSCICFVAVLFCSGCATSALWSDQNLHRYAPAKQPDLELLQRNDGRMILVCYDEWLDESPKTTRRAYWINPEAEPSSAEPRPVFTAIRNADGLLHLPIATTPAASGYSAVPSTNQLAFTLYFDGQKLWHYNLPEYERRTVSGKQAALTPLAVAADLTVIGGAVAVGIAYARAGGQMNSTPWTETK